MRIEIFEIKGSGEISTDIDALILNLYRKYRDKISVSKINILDEKSMKKHNDVIEIIKKHDIDVLPIIKLDGKITDQSKLERMLRNK